MISPINFKNVQTFQGAKKQAKNVTNPQNSTEEHKGSKTPKMTAAMASALAALMITSACAKNHNKINPEDYQETTTSYGQKLEAEEREREAAEVYDAEVRAAEKAYFEEMSRLEESHLQAQYDAIVEKNGVETYLDLDFDNQGVREAYKDVKTALQRIGEDDLKKVLAETEKYNFDVTGLLALLVQQGGIPKISEAAKTDAINQFGLNPNTTSEIGYMVGYYGVCNIRANGDVNEAARRFTGKEQDLKAYQDVIEQLTGTQMVAIANNNAKAAYEANQPD